MEIYLDYNKPVNINVTENNIHIEDSYKITETSKMKNILLIIKSKYNIYECNIIHTRSINSLIYEWQGHNLLYDLHYKRKETKDVDLNNESTIRKIAFFLLSRIYLIANIIRVN